MPPRKRVTPQDNTPVVDDTVKNQENPGAAEAVNRSPEPQIVGNANTGAQYDVSGPYPELVDPDADAREADNNRLRQTDAALNAKDNSDKKSDKPKIVVEFLESGLTVEGKVWKVGEVLELDNDETAARRNADSEGNFWYNLSAAQQKDRYRKVFFEKR